MTAPGSEVDLPFISTGQLPPRERVRALVQQAHARFRSNAEGRNAAVYPALERVDPRLFGVSVVAVDGEAYEAGDAAHDFSIMSVSKPFVFALVCQALGTAEARRRIGVNATGRAFNSLAAIESGDGRTNPMVNSGAIATASLAPGDTLDQVWAFVRHGISRFAGHQLHLDDEVHESAAATNLVNRAIAEALNAAAGCG